MTLQNDKQEEPDFSNSVKSINEKLANMGKTLDKIEQDTLLGKLMSGLMNDLRLHTNSIKDSANKGLNDSYLFSGRYIQWFIEFSKKDALLLEYLLEYQRGKQGQHLTSIQERRIRNTFMDFFMERDFEDTFEATLLFTEIGFTEKPTADVIRCLDSPNFLNVLKLSSKIGAMMRYYETILSGSAFFEKVISVIESYSSNTIKGREYTDIVRNFNTAVTILYHKLKNYKFAFQASPNIPNLPVQFQELLQIWLFLLENLSAHVDTGEQPEIKAKIQRSKNKIKVIIFKKSNAELAVLEANLIKLKHASKDVVFSKEVFTFEDCQQFVEKNGGHIDFKIKGKVGIDCIVTLPIE